MKKTKRNVAIIVVLLFVCAAVYFNWSYNAQWGSADAEMAAAEDAAMAAANADGETTAASASTDDYFAKARLTRQQSRDEALSLLKSASAAEDASQETIDSAMRAISAMASDSMTETQIENLLLAKDFSECVVYITEEGITVAVPAPAEGLSTAQVATITDVIVSETDYTAPQIKVIEVKADVVPRPDLSRRQWRGLFVESAPRRLAKTTKRSAAEGRHSGLQRQRCKQVWPCRDL